MVARLPLQHGLPARTVTIASIGDQACSSIGCSPPPRRHAHAAPEILRPATCYKVLREAHPPSHASPAPKLRQARVDENDENDPNERLHEGDEDEPPSDDRNDENIPDLVVMSDAGRRF